MKRITSLLLICCLLAAMAGPVSAYDSSGITLLPETSRRSHISATGFTVSSWTAALTWAS